MTFENDVAHFIAINLLANNSLALADLFKEYTARSIPITYADMDKEELVLKNKIKILQDEMDNLISIIREFSE